MTTIEEFRKFGKAMIDYVADYFISVSAKRVTPDIKPGYLRALLPEEAPEQPEHWEQILKDVEEFIMPGVLHWRHPHFYAYYPSYASYPPIVADILSGALNGPGFNWMSMPVCTELEVIMMDWLATILGLPDYFKFSAGGTGGGVLQAYASDALHYCMLLARARMLGKDLRNIDKISKLVMYASDQTHSSAQKAALLGAVQLRCIPTDNMLTMRGSSLQKSIEKDRANGLIPFCVVATLGTTNSCAFDNVEELGPVCTRENLWLHIDAAYAGSAFVCKETRGFMKGIEYADSFNVNLHKWLLVNLDCSALWMKDRKEIQESFPVNPQFLRQPCDSHELPNYRNWEIPLGRRFRSLKVWFVLRLYGQSGLQKNIRNHLNLAQEFKNMIISDNRFELCYPVTMGLVCFRLLGDNEINEMLNVLINSEGQIHVTPTKLREKFVIRFCLSYEHATLEHIQYAFSVIQRHSSYLLDRNRTLRNETLENSLL